MPGVTLSTTIATVFCTSKYGRLPTTSIVGSSTAAVSGSSDGSCGKIAPPAPFPETKPWLEITVPSTAEALTTTSKVMVATLFAAESASALMNPAVVFSGALISMPACSAETPADGSVTVTPFRVVLPTTYVVLAGIWSLSRVLTAFSLPMFLTVMV